MPRSAKAALAGAVTGLVCLLAVWWAVRSEEAHERREIARATELVASQIASRLRSDLEKHRIALEQMANFWENSEDVTEEEFHAFASKTMELGPMFLRVVAIDPSSRVQWVHPAEEYGALVGRDLRVHDSGHDTIVRAREAGTAVLSPPLELLDGSRGFVMVAPIVRGAERLGEIAGTFHQDSFFEAFVSPRTLLRYEERISDANLPLFETPAFNRPAAELPLAIEPVDIGGRRWEVHLRPRADLFTASLGTGRTAHWVLGILLAISLATLSGGTVYGGSTLFARLRDRTAELFETRERLDAARERLVQAEKLTAVGELVAGVAHEINNPLSAILGYSQLLASRETRPEVKERLLVIAGEAERTGKIVRNLLTFARKHPPEKELVQLNRIVEKTLELKAYHLQANGIALERDLDPLLPSTLLDFHQIQQVLLNLVNNAEQAILEREGGGRIAVSTRNAGSMLELRVSDDGPGIPEGVRERIFEPFFTTKVEGKGTGLGLPLCFGIVAEHGGTLEVESEVGKGTTFVVRLPLATPPSATAKAATPRARTAPVGLRILVVDDEATMRELLVEMLRGSAHEVTAVGDVPEAIGEIASGRFDVVISDMKMPGGTGRDIHAAIARRAPELARRIVFTTGDGASAQTRTFLKTVGGTVVLKPFKFEEIERAVATVAGRSHGSEVRGSGPRVSAGDE